MKERNAEVGIITFHCSNNYGAMLQAYGLKRFLCDSGIGAEIVRYEPPYMTGRHWWIPYAPIQGLKGRIWGLFNMWNGFWTHMRVREQFSRQRANMNRFRREYLMEKGQPKILSAGGLRRLPYRYYIVGSDQIWNPDITCGLRKAYFGAFESKKKEKVIAYAASFGGTSINARYDEKFARLVSHVDALSVREATAIPYVQKFYKGDVRAVLDPVFFLGKEVWQKAEKAPGRKGYILVYVTESNEKMAEYARKLSREKNLPVIEVRAGQQGADKGFELDVTAGPAEFLGYIHQAEYVVTNSFHAVAFSIIYQKKFLAFAHRSLSARLQNILQVHGLEDKICHDSDNSDIDAPVDWEKVRQKTRDAVKESGKFLLGNLS
nr:polysaccharide pyruvyl transferase family protein [uncultured Acetatifactor sp.]